MHTGRPVSVPGGVGARLGDTITDRLVGGMNRTKDQKAVGGVWKKKTRLFAFRCLMAMVTLLATAEMDVSDDVSRRIDGNSVLQISMLKKWALPWT